MAFPGDQTTSSCLSWALKHLDRELSYAVKVGESVEDLAQAMTRLKERSEDVAKKIAAVRRVDATQQGTSEVEGWLRSVQKIEKEVNSIKADYEKRCRCFIDCSANICSNWNIGRKATKKLLRVNNLYQRGGEFIGETIRVARPGSPPPGQQMPGTSNLFSVDSNLQQVLGYLREDGVRTVGIWGMGGVGKTTLLKAINNKLSSSGGIWGMHFDHVIWVVVSSNAQIQKVQADIAECLKLPNEASSKVRHDTIFNFLNDKKFIILLDDVWERLDLDEIGIPDHRVVLFTTRSELVCGSMEADKKIKVDCLNQDDAWRLFTSKVGEQIISSSPIKELAKEIVEECEGLPLALIVLGRAMSTKHNPEQWQNTRKKLKEPQTGASNIQEPVFRILKYSYDSLENETTRKCFLLCALYSEDYPFGIDELINYFWGHDLIAVKGCKNFGEIYNRGYDEVIGVLKSACLFEANETGKIVKMHDIIRDMALWIARDCGRNNTKWVVRAGLKSEEPLEGVSDWEMAERLSLQHNRIIDVPMPTRKCKKLRTLILQSNYELERIPKGYFECFPALTYLDISSTGITKLPEEVSSLIELQYLDLSDTNIKSLSIGLRNLEKLKHLRLGGCRHLDNIPYGLISCLPMLQHLDLSGSAYYFTSENFIAHKKGKNLMSDEAAHQMANLDELKILKKRQRIKSISLNLKMETILDLQNIVDVAFVRRLKLIALQDSKPQDFLENLTKVAHSIEKLELNNFDRLEELMLATEKIRHEGLHDENWCFHRLSYLVLDDLNGLCKITWTKLMLLEMFPRLKSVVIFRCHGLQNLTWTGHLPCLEYLKVSNCNGLEEIIGVDENGESSTPSSIFPNLYTLELFNLKNLHSISKGTLDSPKLKSLWVLHCLKLKRLSFSFQRQITNNSDVHIRGELEWYRGLEWDDAAVKYSMHFFYS